MKAWTPEMADTAQKWVKESLTILKKDTINVSTKIEDKKLTIKLDRPVLNDAKEEVLLFKSFASLIMQSLRTRHKKEFYGFSVFLTDK